MGYSGECGWCSVISHILLPGDDEASSVVHQSQSSGPEVTYPPKRTYLTLAQEALLAAPENCLTIGGILAWLRRNKPSTYENCDAVKLQRGIRTALSRQSVQKKRTIWEYAGGKWTLDKDFIARRSLDRGREQSSSGISVADRRATEGADHPNESGNTNQSEAAEAQGIGSLDNANLLAATAPTDDAAAVTAVVAPDAPRQHTPSDRASTFENQSGSPRNHGRSTQLTADGTVDESQAATTDRDPTHEQRSYEVRTNGTQSLRPDNGDMEITDPNSVLSNARQQEDMNGVGPSMEGQGESEKIYGEIVLRLRKMKDEYKLKTQKIEADRSALSDINKLAEQAEQARQEELEQARRYDEARQNTSAAEKALEDGRAGLCQLGEDEQSLKEFRRSYGRLMDQLDLAID